MTAIVLKYDGDGNYMRLCNDSRWRHFAMLGDGLGCVKFYKHVGHAKRRCRSNGGVVAVIPEGYSMDMVGNVFDLEDQQHRVSEYIVSIVP